MTNGLWFLKGLQAIVQDAKDPWYLAIGKQGSSFQLLFFDIVIDFVHLDKFTYYILLFYL